MKFACRFCASSSNDQSGVRALLADHPNLLGPVALRAYLASYSRIGMQTTHFTIEIDRKKIACAFEKNSEGPNELCFVLGHGASGDFNTGNLPAIAASLAKADFPVLRYNSSGQLKSRVKILQVSVFYFILCGMGASFEQWSR